MPSGKPLIGGELMFPSEYLNEADLKGKDVSLTISKVWKDDLPIEGGAKRKSVVIAFEKTTKKLVLNKTNAATVVGLHGREANDWVGKKITLYPTTCKFKGDPNYPCIRIREESRA